jgi:hypothetical protein
MKPTPEQVEAAKAMAADRSEEHHRNALRDYMVANECGAVRAVETILLAALEAAEADSARLDWLQHQLANMDSKARGTWLRIGDKGRVQVHRYPLHAMSVWDDSECVMDSIPDGTNDLREAIDAAIKSEKE